MQSDFVDKSAAYLLNILRTKYTSKDRVFSMLAQRAGVSPQAVQRWYVGSRGARMSFENVQGLASALGISMEDLASAVGDRQTAQLFYLAHHEPEVLEIISEAIGVGGETWKKMKAMIQLMRPER